uniref:Myb_DNA-bind_5 domain-containing protein n=1 Tax=Steinernema glaseri TaxID=37863 RepID=A0A1I8A8U2_9BILA
MEGLFSPKPLQEEESYETISCFDILPSENLKEERRSPSFPSSQTDSSSDRNQLRVAPSTMSLSANSHDNIEESRLCLKLAPPLDLPCFSLNAIAGSTSLAFAQSAPLCFPSDASINRYSMWYEHMSSYTSLPHRFFPAFSVGDQGAFMATRRHSKKFTYNQKILLARLYHQGWDVYEGRMRQGEAISKRPSRKQLIMRWTKSVNALDGAEKTPMQVQQRVNDMKKRVRQYRDQIKEDILSSNGRLESMREMSPASKIVDEAMRAQEQFGEPSTLPNYGDDDMGNLTDSDDSRFNVDVRVKQEDKEYYENRASSSASPSTGNDSDRRLPPMRTTFVPANSVNQAVVTVKKRAPTTDEHDEDVKLALLKEELALAKLKRQREEEALKHDREMYQLRKELLRKALDMCYDGSDNLALEDEVLEEDARIVAEYAKKQSSN